MTGKQTHTRGGGVVRRSCFGRLVRAVFVFLLTVLCVVSLYPSFPWLGRMSQHPPFVWALAFPTLVGVGLLILGVIHLLVTFRALGRQRAFGAVGVSALLLGVSGVVLMVLPAGVSWPVWSGNTLASHGHFESSASPRVSSVPLQTSHDQHPIVERRSLRVATFNAAGHMTASDLRRVYAQLQPDVLVIPEAPGTLETLMRAAHVHGTVFHTRADGVSPDHWGNIALTSIIVGAHVGKVHHMEGTHTLFGTAQILLGGDQNPSHGSATHPTEASAPTGEATTRARPTPATPALAAPKRDTPIRDAAAAHESQTEQPIVLMGVHTAPPLPSLMNYWRSDVARVVSHAQNLEHPVIMAGDFNATLRHWPLVAGNMLQDAALACGNVEGTWPADYPQWAQAQIDHVFASPGFAATDCEVRKVGSSDHRAFAVTLTWEGDNDGH